MRTTLLRGATVVALLATLLVARNANATDCTALNGAIPTVFIENGDTQEPLLKRLGQKLVNSATPLRIVYKNRRTCDLANDIYVGNKIVNDAIALKYIPSSTDDPTWDPSKATPTCTADAAGNTIELGIGATFLSSCPTLPAKPADLLIENGPVQSYGFVVPINGTSQVAITAEEGYFAFGFTQGTGQASPWVDQNLRFIRGATASTALTTSAAIGLKATQLKGVIPTNNTSTEVLNLVSGSTTTPDATIGLLGTEVFDANRALVKLLAFKGFQQRYAYWPDSSSGAFDKKNVRDGHYLPWAPTPYLLRSDLVSGLPLSANAARVKGLVFDQRVDADVDGVDMVIASGLVPECAMGVKRDFDGGDLSLYAPLAPCECYFEAKAPQSTTQCKACDTSNPCSGGLTCRRGYCEPR